ncbi:MAG: sensor histidine kinase [Mycobacteriaceae bacterium]
MPDNAGRLPRPFRPARWGMRARSALAAALVVAVALAIASAALLWLLKNSLESASDGAAEARAHDVSRQLVNGGLDALDPVLLATDGRTTLIQVVDTNGRISAASPGAPPTPLDEVRAAAGEQFTLGRVDVNGRGEGGDYRVTALGVQSPAGEFTVLVAEGQRTTETTLETVALLLAGGIPVLVLVVGAATYALVGRSLLSVERMRTRVAAITGADLSERVPVPPDRDEISRLAQTLNAMLTRIEAGHDAQRRFVGDASHELRSPLATVTAALELARDRPEVLDHALLTETLLPEAARMRNLVEDLLLLAGADERGPSLLLGDVDLDDIVDAECRRLRASSELVVTASIQPTRVRGDVARLSRVVRNLVDNAARYAHHSVDLRVALEDGEGVLVVSDDGSGIPDAERARVFERFVRLDRDRARAAGGSGLGLAIVAEIVAAHQGSIEVHGSPAGGAEFVLRLPVVGPQ